MRVSSPRGRNPTGGRMAQRRSTTSKLETRSHRARSGSLASRTKRPAMEPSAAFADSQEFPAVSQTPRKTRNFPLVFATLRAYDFFALKCSRSPGVHEQIGDKRTCFRAFRHAGGHRFKSYSAHSGTPADRSCRRVFSFVCTLTYHDRPALPERRFSREQLARKRQRLYGIVRSWCKHWCKRGSRRLHRTHWGRPV